MSLDLHIQGFYINEGFEYARVVQGSEYDWIVPECLNILEYAGMCEYV